MSHPRLVRRRLLQRLLPVLLFSILFNLTKFFEADITYVEVKRTVAGGSTWLNATEATSYIPIVDVTPLRRTPAYQTYLSWSRYYPKLIMVVESTHNPKGGAGLVLLGSPDDY